MILNSNLNISDDGKADHINLDIDSLSYVVKYYFGTYITNEEEITKQLASINDEAFDIFAEKTTGGNFKMIIDIIIKYTLIILLIVIIILIILLIIKQVKKYKTNVI